MHIRYLRIKRGQDLGYPFTLKGARFVRLYDEIALLHSFNIYKKLIFNTLHKNTLSNLAFYGVLLLTFSNNKLIKYQF